MRLMKRNSKVEIYFLYFEFFQVFSEMILIEIRIGMEDK
jgi:hypothetical protein